MNRGPDPDDWFGDVESEERRTPDAPSVESGAPPADDWLTEAEGDQVPSPWAWPIDRRTITVAASLVVLLLAGLAAAGVFSGGGAKAPTPTTRPATTAATTATTSATAQKPPAPATTLKPGATGTQVTILQRALASLGFSSGKADGKYGPATKDAVARFQRSTGLTADGIFGPATLGALANALRGS